MILIKARKAAAELTPFVPAWMAKEMGPKASELVFGSWLAHKFYWPDTCYCKNVEEVRPHNHRQIG